MEKTVGFIVLEGIDGSGKSTQAALLAEKMRDFGLKVHLTCEPTHDSIGTLIRDIFKGNFPTNEQTIAALLAADRLHHILDKENGMKAKADSGHWIVCDRYYFSSYAYHGAHVDMEWVAELNKKASEAFRPDLTVFLDIDPQLAMERIKTSRGGPTDRYETLSNLRLVREKYLEAFEKYGHQENIIKVDASKPVPELMGTIWNIVGSLHAQKTKTTASID